MWPNGSSIVTEPVAVELVLPPAATASRPPRPPARTARRHPQCRDGCRPASRRPCAGRARPFPGCSSASMITDPPIVSSAWPIRPPGAAKRIRSLAPKHVFVELDRRGGAVDDQIGRDALVAFGDRFDRSHRSSPRTQPSAPCCRRAANECNPVPTPELPALQQCKVNIPKQTRQRTSSDPQFTGWDGRAGKGGADEIAVFPRQRLCREPAAGFVRRSAGRGFRTRLGSC